MQCGTRCAAPADDLLRALGIAPAAPALPAASATAPRRLPRVGLALAAAALATGLVVGVALGPGPAASPAAVGRQIVAIDDPAPAAASAAPAASTPAPRRHAAPRRASPAPDRSAAASAPSPATEAPTPGPAPSAAPTPAPSSSPSPTPAPAPAGPPKVGHVWVIALGPIDLAPARASGSQVPYLSGWLAGKGTILAGYTPLVGEPASSIALLSGQAPNPSTSAGCPTYGGECLYPSAVATLADQVAAAGGTWRAYVEGVGTPCRRPDVGAADPWTTPSSPDGYLTARNPFVYFGSLVDGGACATADVGLDGLGADLADPARTPTLSWIVPSACDDGTSPACAAAHPTGAPALNLFLRHVVPAIRATAAYQDGGLILILPSAATPPQADPAPAGGLLLSPYAKGASRSTARLGPYAVLRTLEDVLGLEHLGHGADAGSLNDLLHTTNQPTTGRSA